MGQAKNPFNGIERVKVNGAGTGSQISVNPFNGIESGGGELHLCEATRPSGGLQGIRSMELKAMTSGLVWIWRSSNPFNGIERTRLSRELTARMPGAWNPFNGIERGRDVHDYSLNIQVNGIRSMELKG